MRKILAKLFKKNQDTISLFLYSKWRMIHIYIVEEAVYKTLAKQVKKIIPGFLLYPCKILIVNSS